MTPKQLRWKRWYESVKNDPVWQERRRASKAKAYLAAKAAGKKPPKPDPEKARERSRRHYAKHREAQRERSRRKPVEARKAAWRRYHEKNRDDFRIKKIASENRRRAMKAKTVIGPIDYAAIVAAAQGHCGICGKPVGDEPTHFDHIVPLSKGGTHTQTNLQLAHASCNIRKGARDVAVA